MYTGAIILAAGRPEKMLDKTTDRPGCLVELAGRPLLSWQFDSLAFVDKICVVSGYHGNALQGDYEKVDNPYWETSGALSSILCARDFADSFFENGGRRLLLAYSDILFSRDHVDKLLSMNGDIVIAYDADWEKLWKLRFANPLQQAASFREEDGLLVEIGKKAVAPEQIQGQYMGLAALSARGWIKWRELSASLGDDLARTAIPEFLQRLVQSGMQVKAIPMHGKWCESESGEDLQAYEDALAKGEWTHDWRY